LDEGPDTRNQCGGSIMQGLFIYAIACFVLGLVFIRLGDVALGLAVCAAGPFWLAIASHNENKDDE